MMLGLPGTLWLAACCACVPAVRLVKRKHSKTSLEAEPKECDWIAHQNTFASGYAIVDGMPFPDEMPWDAARIKCLEVGSACQAVTCDASHQYCSLRGSPLTQPSQRGENTYVPTCHECINLSGFYWTYNWTAEVTVSITQQGCSGTYIWGAGFLPNNWFFKINGNSIIAALENYPDFLIAGIITPFPSANGIRWTSGIIAGVENLQCPFITGIYNQKTENMISTNLVVEQANCAATWAYPDSTWNPTDITLEPRFKLKTPVDGGVVEGILSWDWDLGESRWFTQMVFESDCIPHNKSFSDAEMTARCPKDSGDPDRSSNAKVCEPAPKCSRPNGWCNHGGSSYKEVDCDGDGVPDPYCVDTQGRTGFRMSSANCKDTWPQGNCKADQILENPSEATEPTLQERLHLALGNFMFTHCSANCLYDSEGADEGFHWEDKDKCWRTIHKTHWCFTNDRGELEYAKMRSKKKCGNDVLCLRNTDLEAWCQDEGGPCFDASFLENQLEKSDPKCKTWVWRQRDESTTTVGGYWR